MSEKDFSRLEYRRSAAWPERIEREWPFLEAQLRGAPGEGLVVDLGCGSGEHVRFLVERGYPAIGIDRSEDALHLAGESSGDLDAETGTLWLRADLRCLPLEAACARLALCLGNTLAILADDEAILEALGEARRILQAGGLLVLQLLNYHKLRSRDERSLPLNFRRPEGDDGETELVYLRLMDFGEPDHVSFHVITLARGAGRDDVEVRRAVRRRLRSLEFGRLEELLRQAGFQEIQLFGGYQGEPFEPLASTDVVAVAS